MVNQPHRIFYDGAGMPPIHWGEYENQTHISNQVSGGYPIRGDSRLIKAKHPFEKFFQESSENAINLRVGGKDFVTTMPTLRADPKSILAAMLTLRSPFRPSVKRKFFFDRDPTHFRLILNYLRGNAHIEAAVLPSDERSLVELLVEARFYMLERLEIILEKLRKATGSEEPY